MDILDKAMKKEKNEESFYRGLSLECKMEELRIIFNLLANDEVKHYEILKNIKKSNRFNFYETDILTQVKKIFSELKRKDFIFEPDTTLIEVYSKAQDKEMQNENFYSQEAGKIKEKELKAIFMELAEDERRHYFLLENIIEFVSGPQGWMMSNEFENLDR